MLNWTNTMLTEMENGKKQILGHSLTWETWGTKTYYHWYGVILCTVEKSGDRFVKSFPSTMQTLKEAEVVTGYSTLEQAHESILECFRTGKHYFRNLAERIKADNDAAHKEQEEEKEKYYHLEPSQLTPDHNILYADILSVRALNVLKQAKISTLRELSHLQRSDFAKFRNCGNQTIGELENLLTKVGLTWGMKQYVDSIKLTTLIDKLQTQLSKHPEYADRMVYFDQLHINGSLSIMGKDALELS